MAIQNQWQVSEQKLIVTLKLNRGIIWWAKQMHIHKPNPDWDKPIERVAADKLISGAGDTTMFLLYYFSIDVLLLYLHIVHEVKS